MTRFFTDPFHGDTRARSALLIALYLLINTFVAMNLRHDVHVGYDAGSHLAYVATLAQGRLPDPDDTREFFSAPLGYVLPAILQRAGLDNDDAGKAGQVMQLAYSLAITFVVLRICLLISAGVWLRIVALGLLGMMPAYYRSLAMFRSEALLTALGVVALDRVLHAEVDGRGVTTSRAIVVGVLMGLVILTRQWGLMLLPAALLPSTLRLLARLRRGERWAPELRAVALIVLVAGVTGGWFYARLHARHGSTTAFNRPPQPGPYLLRQPPSFYLDIPWRAMATRPVLHNLARRALPEFYADFWGDYHLMFLVYAQDKRLRYVQGPHMVHDLRTPGAIKWTNFDRMVPFLGRVNVVSVLPTAVLVAGVVLGVGALARSLRGAWRGGDEVPRPTLVLAVLATGVVASFAGFLWFLIGYTDGTGDTIKATYMMQTFPLLAVMGAAALDRLGARRPRLWWVVLAAALLAVAVHNRQTYFTHYPTVEPRQRR
jgi:hypothetical protein